MNSIEFLRPRLIGERFQGHAIPLEVLADLAVLKEFIIEVAKARFLEDHPQRQRSPRGFTDDLDLKLTGIDDGSAVAIITLIASTQSLLPSGGQHYFEQARDSIITAIVAAEQNPHTITEYLPEKALSYFDKFGRSLLQDEAMEFDRGADQSPARLTRETRRRLVLASSSVQEVTEETLIRGLVPEFDQEKKTFEIQLGDGRRIKATVDTPHFDTILNAFGGYRDGVRIVIHGIGRINRNERLIGLDQVHHISILDPLDIPARLDELRDLEDGWLEGHGSAPNTVGLDWLEQLFNHGYPDELPLPYLYPTEDGGIQAEWSLGTLEITIEINLETHVGDWHSLDLAADEEQGKILQMDDTDDWSWMSAQIRAGTAS